MSIQGIFPRATFAGLAVDLAAMPVVVAPGACCLDTWNMVQYRFPRSRKKRIRRKWAKRPENWRLRMEFGAAVVNGTMYVSRAGLDELLKAYGPRGTD